jgi:hypothetical protein
MVKASAPNSCVSGIIHKHCLALVIAGPLGTMRKGSNVKSDKKKKEKTYIIK